MTRYIAKYRDAWLCLTQKPDLFSGKLYLFTILAEIADFMLSANRYAA
jgi:hypothetical protein